MKKALTTGLARLQPGPSAQAGLEPGEPTEAAANTAGLEPGEPSEGMNEAETHARE